MAFVSWVVWFIQSVIICSRSSSPSPSCGSSWPYAIHICILVFIAGSFNFVLSTSPGMDSSMSGFVSSLLFGSSSGWYSERALWLTGLYPLAFFTASITVGSFCLLLVTMAIAVLSRSSMFGCPQLQ